MVVNIGLQCIKLPCGQRLDSVVFYAAFMTAISIPVDVTLLFHSQVMLFWLHLPKHFLNNCSWDHVGRQQFRTKSLWYKTFLLSPTTTDTCSFCSGKFPTCKIFNSFKWDWELFHTIWVGVFTTWSYFFLWSECVILNMSSDTLVTL